MLTNAGNTFSGFLLDWSLRAIERKDLLACERLSFIRTIRTTKWEEYTYKSPVPLLGEEVNEAGTFHYTIVCRRSGSRLLILSTAKDVIGYLLDKEFIKEFSPHLHKVPIAVDPLVKFLTTNPNDYVLSTAYARVPAYGVNLRSASFYGDDLANAPYFKDHTDIMAFFTCGLRHVVGGTEIVRLSTDGSISFKLTNAQRVLDVEQVLHFLREKGYLDPNTLDEAL